MFLDKKNIKYFARQLEAQQQQRDRLEKAKREEMERLQNEGDAETDRLRVEKKTEEEPEKKKLGFVISLN